MNRTNFEFYLQKLLLKQYKLEQIEIFNRTALINIIFQPTSLINGIEPLYHEAGCPLALKIQGKNVQRVLTC